MFSDGQTLYTVKLKSTAPILVYRVLVGIAIQCLISPIRSWALVALDKIPRGRVFFFLLYSHFGCVWGVGTPGRAAFLARSFSMHHDRENRELGMPFS